MLPAGEAAVVVEDAARLRTTAASSRAAPVRAAPADCFVTEALAVPPGPSC